MTPQRSTGPSSASLRIAIHTAPHSAGRQSGLTLLSGSPQRLPRPDRSSQRSARLRHTAPCNSSAAVLAGHCMTKLDPAALHWPHHAVTSPFCTLRLSNRAQKQGVNRRGGPLRAKSSPGKSVRVVHTALFYASAEGWRCDASHDGAERGSSQHVMPLPCPAIHTHASSRRSAVWLGKPAQCVPVLNSAALIPSAPATPQHGFAMQRYPSRSKDAGKFPTHE